MSARRKLLVAAQFCGAAILIVIGVPLVLFAALMAMRAGTRAQEAWYEATALIPFIPAVVALGSASWLIRDALGQREGLSWHQRRVRDSSRF